MVRATDEKDWTLLPDGPLRKVFQESNKSEVDQELNRLLPWLVDYVFPKITATEDGCIILGWSEGSNKVTIWVGAEQTTVEYTICNVEDTDGKKSTSEGYFLFDV